MERRIKIFQEKNPYPRLLSIIKFSNIKLFKRKKIADKRYYQGCRSGPSILAQSGSTTDVFVIKFKNIRKMLRFCFIFMRRDADPDLQSH
jgi:hypothetical protein